MIDDDSCESSFASSESLSTCPGISWMIEYHDDSDFDSDDDSDDDEED